jgi:hypothetical protein
MRKCLYGIYEYCSISTIFGGNTAIFLAKANVVTFGTTKKWKQLVLMQET